MGFFEDLGDSFIGVTTFGQCTSGGCGGDNKAFKLGDTLANTFTFGQCNGGGCGDGHTGTWAPVSTAGDAFGSVFGSSPAAPPAAPPAAGSDLDTVAGSLGISPQELKTLGIYAMLGVGGIILLNIFLDILFKII